MESRTDGELYVFIFSGVVILNIFIGFIFYFIILYRRRQREHAVDKKRMHDNFENTLLVSQLEIQEQTFRNISQEIHDNIGQALTLVKLNLATIGLSENANDSNKMRITRELVSKSISDLRNLSRSLNTEYITEVGICKAIRNELMLLENSGQFATSLTVKGEEYKIESQRQLIVFRMIQEIINNIVKHANATSVQVDLVYSAGSVRISVSDNGCGFDVESHSGVDGSGQGIRNLKSRAKTINGNLTIVRGDKSGTQIGLEFCGK